MSNLTEPRQSVGLPPSKNGSLPRQQRAFPSYSHGSSLITAQQPDKWGIRYCNFQGKVALPPTGQPANSTLREQSSSYFNNQQIYKKIIEWFDSWRPWQQRMLLCGITDRCSTKQLESLAVLLEPVFHRDFAAALKKRYPSASFKKGEKRIISSTEREYNHLYGEESYLTVATPSSILGEDVLGGLCGHYGISEEQPASSSDENNRGLSTLVEQPESVQTLGDFVHILSGTILTEAAEELREELTVFSRQEDDTEPLDTAVNQSTSSHTLEGYVHSLSQTILSEAAEDIKEEYTGKSKGDPPDSTELDPPEEGSVKHTVNSVGNLAVDDVEEEGAPDTQDTQLGPDADTQAIDIVSQHQRQSLKDSIKQRTLLDNDVIQLASDEGNVSRRCSSQSLESMRRSLGSSSPASSGLLNNHRSFLLSSSDASLTDYFSKDNVEKLGPLRRDQRKLLSRVSRPELQDPSIPAQRLYKNMKWWGDEKTSSQLIKPHKAMLRNVFKKQVGQIWQWMGSWEEHEKLPLLVQIIKCCDSMLVNYFATCLQQRIQDRMDINRLPDKLLLYLFSYLSAGDIDSAAKVCRRWRFLCSKDELWMLKCHEMGLSVNVPNVINLIVKATKRKHSIDWRAAYFDLEKTIQQTKNSIPTAYQLNIGGPKVEVSKKFSFSRNEEAMKKILTMTNYQTAKKSSKTKEESSQPAVIPQPDTKKPTKKGVAKAVLRVVTTKGKKKKKPPKETPQTSHPVLPVELPGLPGTLFETHQGLLKDVLDRRHLYGSADELAWDMRGELVQARNVLPPSKRVSSIQMVLAPKSSSSQWRIAEQSKFTGRVKGVKRVRRFRGHHCAVVSILFDQRRLISGSTDSTIKMWDIRSGRKLHNFSGHKGSISSLQFNNDYLYSASWDMSVIVWDLVKLESKAVLTGHLDSVSCLRLTDDFLYSGSYDKTVREWSLLTLLCMKIIEPGHTHGITALLVDGSNLITASIDGTLRMTDIASGECLKVFEGHSLPIISLWMKDNLIVTGNEKGHAWFWDKETGRSVAAIEAHSQYLRCIAFYDGRLFTAGGDGLIKEWDMNTMTCVRSLHGHKGPVQYLIVRDERIISGCEDGTVRIWELFATVFRSGDPANNDTIPTEVINVRGEHH